MPEPEPCSLPAEMKVSSAISVFVPILELDERNVFVTTFRCCHKDVTQTGNP